MRFIVLATNGYAWRVHATVNGVDGKGGGVLHHHTYRDKAAALAVVGDLIADAGGSSQWISTLGQ